MSSNPSQKAPEVQRPPGRGKDSAPIVPLGAKSQERIRQMLKDLDTPLDAVPKDPALDKRFRSARKAHDREVKRQQRSDLKRARDAARKVFRTKPSLSSRRAATAMLTAGAVGLAAFTGPAGYKFRTEPAVATATLDGPSVDPTQVRVTPGMLKTSADFKRALIEEEGVRYVVYRDVAGYPTVGVGHLVDPEDGLRVGDRISKQQVLSFLERDLEEAEQHVRDLVGDLPLYQHEFDALVDLVYNVGPGNVAEDESPRLNAAIGDRDYERIASELDYTHAAGKVAKGLQYRSERRANIFLDALYDDPRELARADTTA